MLFVHLTKYMFLNPLTAGARYGEDKSKPAAIHWAREWNVPYDPKEPDKGQLFVVSDTARPDKGAEATAPMRNVVVGAYEQFFATSRAQDRVVVYFGGHALEVGGKAYLAPLDGDPDEPDATLIPVADFYDKLKACKATQRVVVWEVCRYNPEKGVPLAPGSGPMPEGLAKALLAAPAGVEVVLACGPGENALEFDSLQVETSASAPKYSGSSFLDSARYVFARAARQPGKPPSPADPIPVADWAAAVGRRAAEVAGVKGLKQTVRADGKPPGSWVAFNPDEPPARRFDLPAATKGTSPAEVTAVVSEFNLPPITATQDGFDIRGLVFRDEVMKEYRSDVTLDQVMRDKATFRFQAKTFEAIDKVRLLWQSGGAGAPSLREQMTPQIDDRLKREIKNEQDFWALGGAELEVLNGDLDALAPMRDGQPKRWQAHYDYARAVVKARLAYMNEYNKLLGDVLTETFPERDPKRNEDGWRRVPSEKMKSRKEIQQLAEEAREIYARIITEHKGTPWAVQAKRERPTPLGMAWQPANLNAEKDVMPR
jgi:hypothetical protein